MKKLIEYRCLVQFRNLENKKLLQFGMSIWTERRQLRIEELAMAKILLRIGIKWEFNVTNRNLFALAELIAAAVCRAVNAVLFPSIHLPFPSIFLPFIVSKKVRKFKKLKFCRSQIK
jgi:hypothetical protein